MTTAQNAKKRPKLVVHRIKEEKDLSGLVGKFVAVSPSDPSTTPPRALYEGEFGGEHVFVTTYPRDKAIYVGYIGKGHLSLDERGRIGTSPQIRFSYTRGDHPYHFSVFNNKLKEARSP